MARTKLNRLYIALSIVSMIIIQVSCSAEAPTDLSKQSIIPKPVSVIAAGGTFKLKQGADIYFQEGSDELQKIGQYLAGKLRPSTGYELEVKPARKQPGPGNIYLTLSGTGLEPGDESYQLTITGKLITVAANKPAGVFLGIQTLRQLFPAAIEEDKVQEEDWSIATGTIFDYPVYSYRGAMLDVARHFFGTDDVKRLIDLMAGYKLNVLHLHLSDDQGWRIEIKSWPNLTVHGSSTQVGGGKGGYFTQEQYSDIVRYAQERYITIVPEIDMPGHTNAALASYPELNCDGKAKELYTGIKVGFSTLCTGSEITYKFIDDVVREISALTPGQWFHIGGDESHVTKKEDYIPFVNRVQDIVISHGKKILGWDEIALSSLRPNSTAQHWANVNNAKLAVAQGASLLMSPARKAYIDMQYDKTTKPGLHWAGYIEVDTAYIWDPATLIPGIGKENILGVEAPLWTETITNMEEMEYMVFPRLPGYAEMGWTPASMRKWDEYKIRLADHGKRFEALKINFYRSKKVPW